MPSRTDLPANVDLAVHLDRIEPPQDQWGGGKRHTFRVTLMVGGVVLYSRQTSDPGAYAEEIGNAVNEYLGSWLWHRAKP